MGLSALGPDFDFEAVEFDFGVEVVENLILEFDFAFLFFQFLVLEQLHFFFHRVVLIFLSILFAFLVLVVLRLALYRYFEFALDFLVPRVIVIFEVTYDFGPDLPRLLALVAVDAFQLLGLAFFDAVFHRNLVLDNGFDVFLELLFLAFVGDSVLFSGGELADKFEPFPSILLYFKISLQRLTSKLFFVNFDSRCWLVLAEVEDVNVGFVV